MKLYTVLRYTALALLLNAAFMFISSVIAFYNQDAAFMPLFYSAIITLLFGIFPLIFVPPSTRISNKEGLLIVVLSWFLSCLVGSFPFVLFGGPFSFTNAWFESVSGFTTTGSTILQNIEILPASLLFWRAATQWIGGIGIIIFVMAVLPFVGMAEVVLFRSEVSSMVRENFHHRARKAIQILAGVYIGLTLLETIFLMFAGMNLFDAITHSFTTIATGGFSSKNASVAFYQSPVIEIIIIIFMFLSGIHFALLFTGVTGNFRDFFKSSVVRYYFGALAIGTLVVFFNMGGFSSEDWPGVLRSAAFNLVSVGTSTGFASADTNYWPGLSQMLLIFFGLQCACSGSTSGGIKADRIVLLLKSFARQIKLVMHPNAVIPVRIDDNAIDEDTVNKSILYVAVYMLVIFIATLFLTLLDVNLLDAFTGTVATMGNVGPGLGEVGSIGNFSHIPELGKWIFSITMLMGRLEIYAFFIFFTPTQWKKGVSY
ncbi:MAG: TrkH family potassium uptake protein [Calditrichales bacterium]|nr:MAG: TrkH family potassium uptake protein [Calditrichales bacterium]